MTAGHQRLVFKLFDLVRSTKSHKNRVSALLPVSTGKRSAEFKSTTKTYLPFSSSVCACLPADGDNNHLSVYTPSQQRPFDPACSATDGCPPSLTHPSNPSDEDGGAYSLSDSFPLNYFVLIKHTHTLNAGAAYMEVMTFPQIHDTAVVVLPLHLYSLLQVILNTCC